MANWTCTICTFDNEDMFLACEMCGTVRPTTSNSEQSSSVPADSFHMPHGQPDNDAMLRELAAAGIDMTEIQRQTELTRQREVDEALAFRLMEESRTSEEGGINYASTSAHLNADLRRLSARRISDQTVAHASGNVNEAAAVLFGPGGTVADHDTVDSLQEAGLVRTASEMLASQTGSVPRSQCRQLLDLCDGDLQLARVLIADGLAEAALAQTSASGPVPSPAQLYNSNSAPAECPVSSLSEGFDADSCLSQICFMEAAPGEGLILQVWPPNLCRSIYRINLGCRCRIS